MFGKGALMLITGFSTVFMVYNANMLSRANATVDTFAQYYARSQAAQIAVSAANLACNGLFLSPNWTSTYNGTSFSGGTITINVTNVSGDRRVVQAISTYMASRIRSASVFSQAISPSLLIMQNRYPAISTTLQVILSGDRCTFRGN